MDKKILIELQTFSSAKRRSSFRRGKVFCGIVAMLMFMFTSEVKAQVTTMTMTAEDLVERILGSGIQYSNASVTGSPNAIRAYLGGSLDGGLAPGMETGIVMSTGSLANANALHGPPTNFRTGSNAMPGFTELTQIAGVSTQDGIMLEFDFIPITETININYQFGSEEYNEWVGTSFNDVFAFLITGPEYPLPGKNLAEVAPNVRVTVNNINCGTTGFDIGATYCPYYINNTPGVFMDTCMDGFTVMLSAQTEVTPCETYHIKLMLADGTDSAYDSWVFLQESGFYAVGADVENEVSYLGGAGSVMEGCVGSEVLFCIAEPLTYNHTVEIDWSAGGTATPGVDYLDLPPSITIPAGQTCVSIPIVAIEDLTDEGIETIIATYPKNVCEEGEIKIFIDDAPTMEVDIGEDVEGCKGSPEVNITISPVVTDNIGDLTYLWSTGSTDPEITVNPEETTTYSVLIMDMCGKEAEAELTVTILPEDNDAIFSIDTLYCLNEVPDVLPNISNNNVTGVWSPSMIDTSVEGDFIYTFTPDEGQCSPVFELFVTVVDEIIPEFFPIAPICAGEPLGPLPTTDNSIYGITGSWFPLAMNNQQTTTYTFTPDDGQCAVPVTMTITVNPQTVPSFSQQGPYCAGQTFSLPSISNNGADSVTGFWSPAINNQQTTTYIFTPISGGCNPTSTSMTIVINPLVPPEFDDLPSSICAGSALTLPSMSDNLLSGSWSPSAVDVTQTTTYEFTPTAGQCGLPYTHTIEVVQPTIPTFDLVTDFCYGDTPAALPTLSDNNVQGSWLPSAIDTTITGNTVYTFTPLAGECAEEITVTVNVNEPFVPLFSAVPGICQGEVLAPLPTTSNNGITGSWSPAIDNTQTTTYEFTPDAGQCAVSTTLTIDVEPLVTPLFDAYPVFCSGENIPLLPTTSNNGITGSWSPALNYSQTTTYEFTPDAGICATTATLTITVQQPATPSFDAVSPICAGEALAPLPTTDNNGITGSWSPAIDNTQTTTYTFTPDDGQCSLGTTMTITVNPWVTPNFEENYTVCVGSSTPLLPVSPNGVTGVWNPAFDDTQSGTYTFTPDAGQCGLEVTATVTIVGSVTAPVLPALTYCDPNNDGFGVFDLTTVIPIIEEVNTMIDVMVSFHETMEDAEFNANSIAVHNPPAEAYANIDPYSQTLYVRIDSDMGCFAVVPLDLVVYLSPEITLELPAYELCDDDYDGFVEFDLSGIEDAILNGLDPSIHDISYFHSESEARGNINPIENYINYINEFFPEESIWVRVENTQTGCHSVAELVLVVHSLPVVSLPEVERYVLCDDDYDGYQLFDLDSRLAMILNGQSGLTVSFHDTHADAESGDNAYTDTSAHQNNEPFVETVFVRVETEQGCYVITLMDLVVDPLPVLVPPSEPITSCDGDGDGLGVVNLEDVLEEMLNGASASDYDITFHETYTDAELGENGITTPESYYNTDPYFQILYVRVTTSETDCYNIYPIELVVVDAPVLPVAMDGTLPSLEVCDDNTDGYTTFDLSSQTDFILEGQPDAPNMKVTYHTSEEDAIGGVLAIYNYENYTNTDNPQIIWVRLEHTVTGCYDVASFELIVNLPLELSVPESITLCDEDGDMEVTFDLTIRISDILSGASDPNNYEVEFFHTYAGAVSGDMSELITNPSALSNDDLGGGGVYTLGVRVTDKTTGCESYTIMDVRRAPIPTVPSTPLDILEECDDDNDGMAYFDLTTYESYIRNGVDYLLISYHLTEEEAEEGDNAIASPSSYLSGDGMIYIRVSNPPNQGVSCGVVLELELQVNPLPIVADDTFAVCEIDSTGYADFYFVDFTPLLLGSSQDLNDFIVSYYETVADAEAGGSNFIPQGAPYTNQTQYSDEVWVRIEHKDTGCVRIAELTLYAEEGAVANRAPDGGIIRVCDDFDGVNDGMTEVDLTVYQSDILGGQNPAQFSVTYHTTEDSAHQGVDSVSIPTDFMTTVAGGQTIWVRVENTNTTAPCYALTELELIIDQPADPFISEEDYVLCVDWGSSVSNNAVVLDSGVSGTGYTFEWYHNGVMVPGATGSTLTLDSLGDEGIYSVIAISDQGCISEMSNEVEVLLSGQAVLVEVLYDNAFASQQSITVVVEGNGAYAFQLDDGPVQLTGFFADVAPGEHTVTVYDIVTGDIYSSSSCGSLVIEGVQLIDYPKFFTPNGDGYNDYWNILGLNDQHNAEIYIFDRYGKLLKQLNPLGAGWDGTFNGQPLPSTDYWFKVMYTENKTRKEFKAHFSLKR